MKPTKVMTLMAAAALSASTAFAEAPKTGEEWQGVQKNGAVPINRNSPTVDAWRLMRKDLNKGREPGPINVQRWAGNYPWIGIPTMFHLPVALTKEDLVAGEVEIAFMGAELVGDPRGRTWGPMEMRNPHRSEVYHTWGSMAMPELDTGRTWINELNAVDYGDAPIEPFGLERSIPEIRKMVKEIASVKLENGKRTVPFIIGGGHALMYPDVAGIADVYGKGNVAVIHFDAHADYSTADFGHLVTHGNPIRRLLLEEIVKPEHIIQVGLRGPTSTDLKTLDWAREQGLRYHMMAEVEKRGWEAVMDDVIKEAKNSAPNVFISFDIDVVDPAFIPGTSTPEPGGLYMRETLPLVRRLCAETNVVGFELVELRPDSDPGYTTMLNSKAIVRQCLNGMAVRKAGIEEDNYLHPKMTDDGRK
ncbi:agmatinase family protein [Alkalimarinus sediminis]|uniref:Agmatinase family protein n=1 Tax=Alkalimarinus sediminis TaxID=1632866 RepID=A0A9E8HIH1_9ALTE|nr:agmatinase family protein [Alkalimarinus sediminis]UZW74807.1 agmatinase family protein [Alkalimarinus sediminis]